MAEYVFDYDGWAEQMRTEVFGIAWCVGLYKAIAKVMHGRKGERIVRCRDCKYATPDTSGRNRYKGYLWCDKLTEGIGFSVAPSDFCAWGERKEVSDG
jgi:hypothetical protein